jgi:Beige/BEACH domain
MQHDYETEFFWRKKRLDPRRRFNLLLLEYGEIYYENLSVFQYPVPNQYMKFAESDALKVKGRLHVCSRSIIFEPAEVKRPLLKFPYKLITTELEKFPLKPEEVQQCSTIASGFATFRCSGYFEMKDNDKVGPYRYIDCDSSSNQAALEKNVSPESRFIFALVHTDSSAFFLTTKNLREELIKSQRGEGLTTLSFQQSDQKSAKLAAFDSSQLLDFNEKQLFPDLVNVTRVGPLVLHPGGLMVTGNRIYFQPSNLNNIGDLIQHFDVRKIKRIFSRRYLLRQIGMEIFFTDTGSGSDSSKSVSSVYFVFESNSARDHMVSIIEGLPHFPDKAKDGSESVHAMTRKWQLKEISNFDYLLYLNSEADRSFSDLTQYPIMPHIIADYESKALDLTKASTFRDLSKPIGALNPQRLSFFKERYESMSSVATEASSSGSTAFPPPFLYGTHYSTPGYVLYYLVRVAPEHMLCLQNGKFDAADRMFYSISGMFSSCLSNPADLKELIPEFFDGEGEFLSNNECLNLGRRHDGDRVDDVELPPWARNPKDFIKKSRQALECKYVSERLHHWIDLIFGYKQRGQEAFLADNLFYHLTYEGALDLDKDDGDKNGKLSKQRIMEREAIDVQIQEFGQTPKQLFSSPHPTRFGTKEDVDDMQSIKSAVKTAAKPSTMTISIDAGKISKTASPTAKVEKVLKVVQVEVSPSRKPKGPVELSSSSTPQIPTANISPTNNGRSSIDTKGKSIVESSSGEDVNSNNGTNTVTSSALATTSSNMEGRKSSSGMILLGDDFRAEVTRELLVQRGLQDRQQVEGLSVTDLMLSGALVVQKKGAIRDEMKSETHYRTEDNSNSSNTFKDEMDGPGSPVVQSAVPLKSRMQSLWGSITDKTISIIRPDKSRTDSTFVPSRTGIRAGSISSMEDKVSVPSSSDASSPVSYMRGKGMPNNNNNNYNTNNGNGLYNQPSVIDTNDDDVIIGTSEIERIDLQLWMEHQLPKGLPITGLSALQVSSSTSDVSLLLCAITKDATLTIVTADFNHPAVQKVPPKDSVKDLHVGGGGWQSISEKEDTSDDNQRNDTVKLISFRHRHTFNASGDSAALDMISRPLGFLPTMFTTAFLSSQGSLNFPFPCCCKLSQDATKLSVFSQRGHDCHLLRYQSVCILFNLIV